MNSMQEIFETGSCIEIFS